MGDIPPTHSATLGGKKGADRNPWFFLLCHPACCFLGPFQWHYLQYITQETKSKLEISTAPYIAFLNSTCTVNISELLWDSGEYCRVSVVWLKQFALVLPSRIILMRLWILLWDREIKPADSDFGSRVGIFRRRNIMVSASDIVLRWRQWFRHL
jgi:hypothetical protein